MINILLYHQIGEKPNENTNLNCFCNTGEFIAQMDFLYSSDYKVISLRTAMSLISGEQYMDNKYVVLTFDDGCEKFFDIAFPILESRNFQSIVYPVVGLLGKYATWGKKINNELKILSKNMVVELSTLGVDIGAHTINHRKLTQIQRFDAFYEIKKSKDLLEQLIGKNIDSFAYPHGDFDKHIIEIVKESDFNNAVTCIDDHAETAKSQFEIPRKYITFFDTITDFKKKLI